MMEPFDGNNLKISMEDCPAILAALIVYLVAKSLMTEEEVRTLINTAIEIQKGYFAGV